MKEEKILSGVFVLFIAILHIFAFSGQPCDIDNIYLSCRVTGSIGDILGFLILDAAAGFIVWRTFNPTYAESRGHGNFMMLAPWLAMVLGIVLIWNL